MNCERYRVRVHRTCVQEIAIEVEAGDPAEAERKALDQAPNEDFGGQRGRCRGAQDTGVNDVRA